eukprot:339523-Prymnesium_polylepis.1
MPSSRAQLVFQWKGWSQQSVLCMGPQPSPSSPHTTHAMRPVVGCRWVCVAGALRFGELRHL